MSELPAGWTESPLVDLISEDGLFSDGDWVESKDQDPNGAIRLLQLADIGDGKFLNKSNRFVNDEKFELLNCTEILEGDVLVARMPDPLGRACLMPKLPQKCITVVDVAIIRPGTETISTNWLMHFLNSPRVRQEMQLLSSGSTRKRISRGNLSQIVLPVPPSNEQKRIAEKLDSLLARVDSCQTHLERVPQILKRFRQSVLAAATSGRLTEDWREEDNPVSRQFGDFEFPDFPANWNLFPIKEVGQVKGGKRLPNGEKLVDYDTGFPYIRAGQLKKGTVIAEDQLYLLPSTQKKISRYIVDAGDVYITIVGASIGDAGVIPQNYDKVNLTENAAKICQLTGVDGNYLALWLRSPHAQDIIKSLIKSGAQGKLALTRINEIPVPLPSLEEQAEIVRRVEKLFAYAERLEARYTSASEHVERLTPSLLAKAFRGELVEQDAEDEPASVLLERIKEAIAKAPKESKKSQRRTTMKSTKSKQDGKRISIVQALQEAGKALSSDQLFAAAGFPSDAEPDLVEEFFVEIRDALKNKQITRERKGDLDWFSLAK